MPWKAVEKGEGGEPCGGGGDRLKHAHYRVNMDFQKLMFLMLLTVNRLFSTGINAFNV